MEDSFPKNNGVNYYETIERQKNTVFNLNMYENFY